MLRLITLVRKIGNLVGVIGDSGGSATVFAALEEAEARKAALEAELAIAEAPAPRLMPNLDALYRAKVAVLREALGGEDAAAARQRIRALIDVVMLIQSPAGPKAPLSGEVRGILAAMLGLLRSSRSMTHLPWCAPMVDTEGWPATSDAGLTVRLCWSSAARTKADCRGAVSSALRMDGSVRRHAFSGMAPSFTSTSWAALKASSPAGIPQ